ncbi:MAG: copper resistance protein CopC [Acetobacteraceae bacterium]|nr:copper resistance protein CopC [Acetobacteraceae bacterium]
MASFVLRLRLVLGPMLLALPAAGQAHAILVSSEPAANGTVASGPQELEFRFNSRIDSGRSRLTLTDPDSQTVVIPVAGGGVGNVLLSKVDLKPGAQTVRWQVLAVDGHITRGSVPFTVRAP